MACEFVVMLPPSDAPLLDAAFAALECLDAIEANLTVYRPDSEISQVNSNADKRWVPVSPTTFELIEQSIRWSEQTGGAFDITAGPLIRTWGFLTRQGKKPTRDEVEAALETVGYQHLRTCPETHSIRFAKPGMEINLGAIGKGFALDQLAGRLVQAGIKNFLLHGGGSSVLARGNQSPVDNLSDEPESRAGWAVGIAHPTKPNLRLAGIRLIDAALSTSGSGKQFFHHRGKRFGHVIDPRTGYPAGEMLSLTAICPNATDAEACSTASFLSPMDELECLFAEPAESAPTARTLKQADAMIATVPRNRQDEVEVTSWGEILWIDPPQLRQSDP
ncbi:FAD:protein FMN transferase [Rhodopirellula sp. MGV]|uniref:FAD:protein FMN transferase n=1 Tax=Rhodopirellula sp. MGV TaxID=2023130 RepID=UPI001E3AC1C6|nr:FAD:protein FMN transferase [Rhodopirellula sp. MGV]